MAGPIKPSPVQDQFPARPIDRITRSLTRFLAIQSGSGIVLAVATFVALFAANSAWAPDYKAFWDTIFRIGVGEFNLEYPLWYWINDALMAIFFFVVGLEIKRELVMGELRDPKSLILPVAAAIGGAAVPVGLFFLLQPGGEATRGWAVPMATDIAFVVGCLALLGNRVPVGLKILMLSLAIVDDILAIVVIALFYSSGVKLAFLGIAVVGFVLTVFMNRVGVRSVSLYVLVGACVWLASLKSGIHPTVAGVVLGLLTPAAAWIPDRALLNIINRAATTLDEETDESTIRATLHDLSFASTEAVSPLVRIETALHPWVAFGVMPVFGLANAGIVISIASALEPVSVAIAVGLCVGKPVGIIAAAWLLVRMGWATLPRGVTWPVLAFGACLAGIGFTMAMFIAGLGLEGAMLDSAKTGVLFASALAGLVGMVGLYFSLPRNAVDTADEHSHEPDPERANHE